jgi:hypothetical protein
MVEGQAPDAIALPNVEAVVLNHGIADFQLLDCGFYFIQRLLPKELRTMDADDGKTLLVVFLVPAPQLRDNVFAVDSTIGPDFE